MSSFDQHDFSQPLRDIHWLDTLSVDRDLIAAFIAATWEVAAEAQLARLALIIPAGVLVGTLRAGPPATADDAMLRIVSRVRELQAYPPSEDVRAAMGGEQ